MNYEYVYVYEELKSKTERERTRESKRTAERVCLCVEPLHFQNIEEQSSKLDRII